MHNTRGAWIVSDRTSLDYKSVVASPHSLRRIAVCRLLPSHQRRHRQQRVRVAPARRAPPAPPQAAQAQAHASACVVQAVLSNLLDLGCERGLIPSFMADESSPKAGIRWPILIVSFVVGLIAWAISVFVASYLIGFPRAPQGISPMFPLVAGAWEQGAQWIALSLAILGMLLGALTRVQPIAFGIGTMIAMPVLAFIEAANNPNTHNLLGIELALYAVWMAVPIGTTYLGRWIRSLVSR
jgi:hypothetical protein